MAHRLLATSRLGTDDSVLGLTQTLGTGELEPSPKQFKPIIYDPAVGELRQIRDEDRLIVADIPTPAEVLTADKTIYVATDGNDTTGDGTTEATAFATLNRAAEEFVKYIPGPNVSIIVKFSQGTYEFTEPYVPTYASGSSVRFTGVDSQVNHGSGISLSNFDIAYSTDGSFSGVQYFEMDVTLTGAGTAVEVGEFLLVRSSTGGTNPQACNGLHKITAYDSGTEVATVRVWSADGVSALPSGSITATVTQFRVILKYTLSNDEAAIEVDGIVDAGEFQSLVVEADSSTQFDNTNYAFRVRRGGVVRTNVFGAHGWNSGVYADGAGIFANDGTGGISKCKNNGVQAAFQSQVDMSTGMHINGCGAFGLRAQYSQLRFQSGFIVGCAQGIRADMADVLAFGSSLYFGDGASDVGITGTVIARVDARSTTISGFTTATSTATSATIET